MERAAWLRSFGLGRDPFEAPDARRDEVLALEPMGMLHVRYADVHGATEVPHSCLIEGVPGSGRTALCMQLVAEDEHAAIQRPGLGRRVVPIDRFTDVARGVEERRGGEITVCEAIDLVLHRIVPEIVDEVLGVANDGTRPRRPVADAAAAIESAGPSACRDLVVLQALYDRADGAPSRTMLLRDRFALSGGVLAEASRSWGLVLLGSSAMLGTVLVWFGDRRDAALVRALPSVAPEWAQALPWIGLGLILSAGLGLLGRWTVAGLFSRSRVRRAMRSIVVTDRDAEDLATCLNEWRPVDLRRVPKRGRSNHGSNSSTGWNGSSGCWAGGRSPSSSMGSATMTCRVGRSRRCSMSGSSSARGHPWSWPRRPPPSRTCACRVRAWCSSGRCRRCGA